MRIALIAALARGYQRDALRIDTVQRNRPHADIEYRAIRVAPNEVELGVVNVLRLFDAGAALVFCSTREAVRHLHASLVERGFAAVALSGELTQNERNNALQSLRDQILTLPPDTLLCPGHGPFTTVAQERAHNPFGAS